MTNVGSPGNDEFGEYGLHGRASNLPAQLIGYGGRWLDNEYELWLQGCIRESSVFGFNLQLTRMLTTRLGQNYLQIVDKVENCGDREAPFMLLYHCNFGFPLLSEGTRLVLNKQSVHPRDDIAKSGLKQHLIMDAPQVNFAEQVFFHDVKADNDGFVTAAVINNDLHLAAYVRYRKAELPNLIQWKQMGAGTYVLGIEPANCLVLGRHNEREEGTLQTLAPGEAREIILQIGIMDGSEEITQLINAI